MNGRSYNLGESGAVAIWVAGTLAVMIGIMALSFDLGRSATTDTELKWASDAAALAGARQLDGLAGARDRARLAATGALTGSGVGLTKNADTFDSDATNVQVVDVKFLSVLGAGEGTAGDVEATSDTNANYIQVIVEQSVVNNFFIQVVGGADTTTLQESSVAGYGAAICQIPPLFVCNPKETTTNKTVDLSPGMGILVRDPGAGNRPGPGNYGLLQVPGFPGKSNIREAFASANGAPVCFNYRRADTEPGDPVSINAGINVRLDIYKSPLNPADGWIGPPAKNVASGYAALSNPDTKCNPGTKNVTDVFTGGTDTTAQMMPYPRDKCFYNGGCVTSKFGDPPFDGYHWDRDTYCKVNHPPAGANCPAFATGAKETMTRYGMYRAEIEQDKIPDNTLDPGKTGTGQSQACYTVDPWTDIPAGPDVREPGYDPTGGVQDRRVITTAVVNCLDQNMNGRKNIQIAKWYLMFLTEPAGYEIPSALLPPGMPSTLFDNQNIFLEVIREIEVEQDKAIAHEIVQLYR
jgi:putative Flp pilus-assembly TadE/G-like protein